MQNKEKDYKGWRSKKNAYGSGELDSKIIDRVYRIAALMPEYSELYKTVYDAFEKKLKDERDGKFEVERFVSGGTSPHLLDRHVDLIIDSHKNFDAIFTIGITSTHAAKRRTLLKNKKMPVVFSAVNKSILNELVHSQQSSRNNLTGIAVITPCQILPIQALQKVNPEARTFLVPYREEFMNEQMLESVAQAQEYFKQRGCRVETYAYTGNRLPEELFSLIPTYDSVLIPEGGAKFSDRDAIIECCKRSDVSVHADGAEAIKKGAIFAVTSDSRYMGYKAAEKIMLVTRDMKKPSDVATTILTKMRQILYSQEVASKLGVSFSKEYKMMLETCTKNNVPMPRQLEDEKLLLAYCEDNSLGLQEAMRALTKQIEEQVDYITNEPVSTDSDVIDMSQVAAQKPAEPKPFKLRQEEKKKKIESDINKIIHKGFVQSLYIAGPQAIQAAAQRMEEIDRHRPLSAIQFAQSLEEAVGLDIQMPPGNTVHATIMQPPRAETIAHYLKEYMGSDLRSAYFLIGHDALQDGSYISSFSVQAKMLNFRVNPIIVENEFDIQRAMEKHQKRHNAFFSVAHLISPSLMEGMVFYGDEFKIMTLAPSLEIGKKSPLSFGFNPQAFSEEVSPFQQLSPYLYARVIPADLLYLHGANTARLITMGYKKAHERALKRAHKIVLTS